MADIQKIQVDGKVYDVRDEASRLLIEKIQKEMPASLSQGDNGGITLVNSAGTPIGNILNVSGGGTCSWNNLEDRPFYDETYTGTMTFQYDGDPTGKTTVTIPDGSTLVKTSDWTAEPSDLIGATGTVGEQTMVITADMIADARVEGIPIVFVAESMFIVYEPCNLEGIIFPESGTYMVDMGVSASLVFTGTATRVHTINRKYLPGGFTGGGGVSNVHVLDIGSADLDVTELDLSNYANGDVLVIIQNMSQ